jgi:general nucleoside transport system ATP-binding protein
MDVELLDIHKTFGAVRANVGITLKIPAGTIQGILGENGAGKSTLMKILSGFIHADHGEIILDGRPVRIYSPADAIRQGVGMLHQDPLDFPPMTALDNFLLGHPGKMIPDRKNISAEFKKLAGEFEFSITPDSYVDTLTVGERQQLEILRLLWSGAKVLILDEPTTGISAPQKEKLFTTLQKLASQGMTIILVSHKLEDVEFLCHRIAVLRQGELVGMVSPPYRTDNLVELMFGKVILFEENTSSPKGDIVLTISGLTLEDGRLQINALDFSVHAGEVIGLAGMEGSGQDSFLEACAGLIRPVHGNIFVNTDNLTGKSHHVFKSKGVAYLPAARLERGLVPGLNLSEHFVLAEKPPGIFINHENAQRLAEERIAAYNIKGTPSSPVEALSGGNQQRAILSFLRTPLKLVLLEHPTRGLDIESMMYIWRKLKERCQQGSAIIFLSSDLDEILQYSDRILVFFAGRVSPPLDASSITVEQLGQLIGGKNWDKQT